MLEQVNVVRIGEDMRLIWGDHKTKNVAVLAIPAGVLGTFF